MGENAANLLIKNLKTQLTEAIKQKGPEYALNFCSEKGLVLTLETEKQLAKGIEIKRTSAQYRNPHNAPDKYEQQVLQYFTTSTKKNEKTREYVQEVSDQEKSYYRYYKPLYIKALCLTCHGDPKQMSDNLRRALREKYPDDKAVNYKTGDFRGMVRVTIPKTIVE